jgi:putative hydrolase of the HAD superfamily
MSRWNTRSEPVEAVLFDLGNTLVSYYRSNEFAPILRRCVASAALVLDAHVGGARGRTNIEAAYERGLRCNVERPDYRVWPLAERLERVFELDGPDDPLVERLGAAFLEPIFATAKLDPEAIGTLRSIRRLGLKTAIVSNTPWGSPTAAWRAELARHGLLGEVDAAVFCVDVGWRKPARAPFERALAALGASASRSWFVGDDPIWDVEGARGAGLTPVVLAPLGDQRSTPARHADSARVAARRVRSLGELTSLIELSRSGS